MWYTSEENACHACMSLHLTSSPPTRQEQGAPRQKSGSFLAALFTLDYTPFKGVTT